jgi:hypothetical protein
MILYETTIDTIFLCFLIDDSQNKVCRSQRRHRRRLAALHRR